eukprot:GFYU01004337.1.p1 GENE.GFYU01004337.1~~GFYU01004337.1.p1  ORF type:complete len:453 (+),score=117.52 GFYU01004337.1:159-1517(+)
MTITTSVPDVELAGAKPLKRARPKKEKQQAPPVPDTSGLLLLQSLMETLVSEQPTASGSGTTSPTDEHNTLDSQVPAKPQVSLKKETKTKKTNSGSVVDTLVPVKVDGRSGKVKGDKPTKVSSKAAKVKAPKTVPVKQKGQSGGVGSGVGEVLGGNTAVGPAVKKKSSKQNSGSGKASKASSDASNAAAATVPGGPTHGVGGNPDPTPNTNTNGAPAVPQTNNGMKSPRMPANASLSHTGGNTGRGDRNDGVDGPLPSLASMTDMTQFHPHAHPHAHQHPLAHTHAHGHTHTHPSAAFGVAHSPHLPLPGQHQHPSTHMNALGRQMSPHTGPLPPPSATLPPQMMASPYHMYPSLTLPPPAVTATVASTTDHTVKTPISSANTSSVPAATTTAVTTGQASGTSATTVAPAPAPAPAAEWQMCSTPPGVLRREVSVGGDSQSDESIVDDDEMV